MPKGFEMRVLFLALLFISFKAHALSSHCENHYAVSTEVNGQKVKMAVPGSKISAAGTWNPSIGEPTLSIIEAYQLAKDWAKENLSRYDSAEIEEITLKKYGCSSSHSDKEYWYYFIEYTPEINGNKLWGGANWLVILFSGEVLVPIKE